MSEENKENEVEKDSLDIIYPNLKSIILGGIECKIARLKFRQTIALLQVVFATFPSFDWSAFANHPEQMTTVLMLSVTKATGQFYNFLDEMIICQTDAEKIKLREHVRVNLENDELLDVIQIIVDQEKDSFGGWLKKVLGMLQLKEIQKITQK